MSAGVLLKVLVESIFAASAYDGILMKLNETLRLPARFLNNLQRVGRIQEDKDIEQQELVCKLYQQCAVGLSKEDVTLKE